MRVKQSADKCQSNTPRHLAYILHSSWPPFLHLASCKKGRQELCKIYAKCRGVLVWRLSADCFSLIKRLLVARLWKHGLYTHRLYGIFFNGIVAHVQLSVEDLARTKIQGLGSHGLSLRSHWSMNRYVYPIHTDLYFSGTEETSHMRVYVSIRTSGDRKDKPYDLSPCGLKRTLKL